MYIQSLDCHLSKTLIVELPLPVEVRQLNLAEQDSSLEETIQEHRESLLD
jgi:hypothetical protein